MNLTKWREATDYEVKSYSGVVTIFLNVFRNKILDKALKIPLIRVRTLFKLEQWIKFNHNMDTKIGSENYTVIIWTNIFYFLLFHSIDAFH